MKYKSKLHWDITSHLLERLELKVQEIISIGKDLERKESSCTIVGNENRCNHCGKTVWIFYKKLKMELPYDSVIPQLGIFPHKNCSTICNRQDMEATQVPIYTWITKMWDILAIANSAAIFIHIFMYILYYWAIKRMKSCYLQQHAWAKSDWERQISYEFTHMWNLKTN